jgi:TolB protein
VLQLKIVNARVNLRAGPGTNFAVIGGASQDEQFVVVGRNAKGDWYKISLSSGKTAWVNGGLVTVLGDATQIPTVKEETTPPPAATTAAPVANAPITGQARGRLLYSVANMDAKRWELWEYNFGSSENKKIADWRTEIDVSKDGKQIVYFAWPDDAGDKAGIWIMDADFSNNRLVVPGGAYPSFSPGGDRLVANGRENLYVLTTDGKNIRGLTNGEYPAWSPVNDQIVHRACVGGNCGLWLIDANSNDPGARTRLTTGGGDGQPAWSPDGKRIAYISKEDGNFEIYVINADSSNKLRLTTNPSSDGLPVWSPDGKWIAFRSDRGGAWAIYIMRPDGSDVRKVVDANVLPLWFFEKMDWR